MRSPRLLTLSALAALAAGGLAHGAPPPGAEAPSPAWTRTGTTGAPAGAVAQPSLLFGASGPGLIAWASSSATGAPVTHVATWKPGDAPVDGHHLADGLATPPLAIGGDRVLFARRRTTFPRTGPSRTTLSTSVGSFAGEPGHAHVLTHISGAVTFASAASRSGEVALAWIDERPPAPGGFETTLRLRLAVKPRDGQFRAPVTVAQLGPWEHPGVSGLAAAYDRRGTLVLAFPTVSRSGRRTVRRVETRIGKPGAWRRQVLGSQLGITDIVAATSASGRIVVGWQTQDGGEEANVPARVLAALREPNHTLFTRTRELDAGGAKDRPPGRVAAAVAPNGTAALIWSQVTGRFPFAYPVVVATAPAGGPFGAPQALDALGVSGDVAFAADGRAIAVWSRILRGNQQEPDQIFAAVRDAGAAAFGAPEAVSEADVATEPAAAVDPATGSFVAAWSERPGDAPPPEQGGAASAVLGAALRTG